MTPPGSCITHVFAKIVSYAQEGFQQKTGDSEASAQRLAAQKEGPSESKNCD
jgi:hypothetical protein